MQLELRKGSIDNPVLIDSPALGDFILVPLTLLAYIIFGGNVAMTIESLFSEVYGIVHPIIIHVVKTIVMMTVESSSSEMDGIIHPVVNYEIITIVIIGGVTINDSVEIKIL